MDDVTHNPAPDDQTTFTLYRFCARHRLDINAQQRSTAGMELSRLAGELKLPLKKVRERVGPGQWSRSRIYPEWFLKEWLARHRQAQVEAPAVSPDPRPRDMEHRREDLEAVKCDLYQAFRVSDPAQRRAILGSALPRLFTCHGVAARQAPAPPQSDAAVLIDFDEALFLVELKWSDKPLDFRQLAPHLVTLYDCPDLRGLLISSSGFTDQAIRDLSSIMPPRLVLGQLDELVLLIEQGRDLKDLLRAKVRAAETAQKPFVRVRGV
jgi:hypothetical protein